MADALEDWRVGASDVVAVMAPNRFEMLAAHFAVPVLGAVINALNPRLDVDAVTYILKHSEARVILADMSCAEKAQSAAAAAGIKCVVLASQTGDGGFDVLSAPPARPRQLLANVKDEWQPIALNYTSGTTGRPKGVVYHHRGAYLNAIGNLIALGFDDRTRYLWTLPLFHCNGWCHAWAVTAATGFHVCLDKVDPQEIFDSIADQDVTHMSCAPVVLNMLLDHPARSTRNPSSTSVRVASGGSSPSSALICQMDALGFEFIHLYGLTESFGPTSACSLHKTETELDVSDRAKLLSSQGNRHLTANHIRVIGQDGQDVPMDGSSVGEIVLRGNTLMAGYYADPRATDEAFSREYFSTGDLAVMHSSGNIEIRDRSKDVIISGGENISSIEVENVLQMHPAVLMAAIVAAPDSKWGETPCAFVELRANAQVDSEELRKFCRLHLASFKIPRTFVFQSLPRTATGKIQKFLLREAARTFSQAQNQ
jgi:fatty-acyl-CoA synthase